jgi:hypothetical protein
MVATGTLKWAEASLGFKSVFRKESSLFIPLLSTMPWSKSQDFRDGFRLADIAAAVCQPDGRPFAGPLNAYLKDGIGPFALRIWTASRRSLNKSDPLRTNPAVMSRKRPFTIFLLSPSGTRASQSNSYATPGIGKALSSSSPSLTEIGRYALLLLGPCERWEKVCIQ